MSRRAKQAVLWTFAALVLCTPSIRASDVPDAQETEALWLADHDKLVHKVQTLVIGDVNLKEVTGPQLLDFVRRQSKLFDPDHQGVNIVNSWPELDSIKLDVKLKHATVEQVLHSIPMCRVDVGDFVVELEPEGDEEMWSRTFNVPDNVLPINPSMLTDKRKQIYDVRPLFEAKGIKFPPGTSADYDLPAKTLTVILPDSEEIIHVDRILVFGFKNS